MPEAVIVATARSPDRARQQGLARRRATRRPRAPPSCAPRCDKVPQLDPAEVEDVIIGCAQPAGEQGYNLGRVVAILAGLRRRARAPR